mgnify:CR=1 FL=1
MRSVRQAVEIFAPCRSFLARAGAFLLRRGHAATFWLRLRRAALFLACVLVAVAIPSVAGPIRFRDATQSSGIGFVHTDGSSGKRYIVETVASGAPPTGLPRATYEGTNNGALVWQVGLGGKILIPGFEEAKGSVVVAAVRGIRFQ